MNCLVPEVHYTWQDQRRLFSKDIERYGNK